jgi:hypothetical protein
VGGLLLELVEQQVDVLLELFQHQLALVGILGIGCVLVGVRHEHLRAEPMLRGIAFLGIIGLLSVQAFVCVLAVTHSAPLCGLA